MHRVYRPWAAGRESQLFAPLSSSYHYCPSFLHRHVSIKRLSVFTRRGGAVLFLRRSFTKSCYTELPSQAVHPSQEDDEHNNTTQQYTSYRINSFPDRKSVTAERHVGLRDSLAGNSLDDQPFSNETHVYALHDHDTAAESGNGNKIPVSKEDLAVSNGFWSLQTFGPALTIPPSDVFSVEIGTFLSASTQQPEKNSPQLPAPTESVLKQLWAVQSRPGKIDLSYWDPVRGERQGTKLGWNSDSTGFRSTGRERLLVANFVQLLYTQVSSTVGLSDSAAHLLLTRPVFTSVKTEVDLVLNILSWSWIVVAPPALRLKRLIHWSRSEYGHVTPNVPLWLVLQLLRSGHISPGDLVDLVNLIDQKLGVWNLKSSMMILVVRLLRHARLSHPACLSRTIKLFMRLLDHYFLDEPSLEDEQRRAHWCNRVLTLLALPIRSRPFKHVIVQQDAQLLLLHYMHDVSPVIPLNREGYRALAKLQLMHAKTDAERMWAEVQADTWPPWERQHQMGVSSPPRESPGSTSRTNLVLHRMREDGYSPHTFDMAAQILGGRDSDGSPTAQVRRPSTKIPLSAAWLPGPDSSQFETSAQIWTARITATRTVREAWMGLCAYENAVKDTTYAVSVYHAMFEKLWADTIPARSDTGPLPGDGLENFADPELARDRVHVPEEPPSVEGLYNRMMAKGIKPSGTLLSDLLLRETDLHRGLAYIKDSLMKAKPKMVLANPMVHSPEEVAKVLFSIHKDTKKAYIGLLTRPNSPRNQPRLEFPVESSGACIPGPVFAFRILQNLKNSWDYSLWSEYFAALSRHGLSSEEDRWRISVRLAWTLMCDIYAIKRRELDASALPHVLLTARSVQTWTSWNTQDTKYEPLDMSMKFFMEAVSGARSDRTVACHEEWARFLRETRSTLHSVPTADDIQEMAFLMIAAQQRSMVKDVLHLLRWAYKHQQLLASVSTFTKRNLAAFRVFLEGQWALFDPGFMDLGLKIMIANRDQINEAKEICHQLGGWASNEDVSMYLRSSHHMFARLKHKLKHNAQMV